MKKIILLLILIISTGCNIDYDEDSHTTTTTKPVSEIKHMVLERASEVRTVLYSSETRVLVFGRKSSGWCKKYLEIISKVAKDQDINIYYVDLDNLIEFEMSSLFALNIMIPAKCTHNEQETNLISTMATPLTLFVRDKESIDCISGFIPEKDLLEYLKEHELIN